MLRHAVLVLVCGIAILQSHSPTCHAEDALLETLVPLLRQLAAQREADADSLARNSYHLVWRALVGMSQSRASSMFTRQNVRLVDVTDTGSGQKHEYLVQTNMTLSTGLAYDLYILTRTKRTLNLLRSSDAPIASATSELRAIVDHTIGDAFSSGLIERDSSIGRVLQHPDVQAQSQSRHILRSVVLGYDQCRHHREEVWPFGYAIRAKFVDRAGTDTPFLRLWGWVLSNLDRPTSPEGVPVDQWPDWMPIVEISGWECVQGGLGSGL